MTLMPIFPDAAYASGEPSQLLTLPVSAAIDRIRRPVAAPRLMLFICRVHKQIRLPYEQTQEQSPMVLVIGCAIEDGTASLMRTFTILSRPIKPSAGRTQCWQLAIRLLATRRWIPLAIDVLIGREAMVLPSLHAALSITAVKWIGNNSGQNNGRVMCKRY